MYKLMPLFLTLLIFTLSCTPSCKNKPSKDSLIAGDAAAIVNDVKLSLSKLDQLSERAVEQMNKTGHKVDDDLKKRMRASILKKMIDDEVMRQKAESLGIKVDRFERVDGFLRYKARLGGEQAFLAFLKQRQLTEGQVLETVVEELTRTKLVEKLSAKIDISDQEITEHYKKNANLYTMPLMVRARHILFKLDKADPKEKAALVLKKAKSVLEEAQKDGASFEALAEKYSEGPTAAQKGDLGFFARGRMVKEFEDAAFDAPLKTAVGPVKTEYGYHIIYVEQKTPERVATLDEVRARIVELLSRNKEARKAETMLVNLRKTARLKILDASLTELDYQGKKEAEIAAKAAE